MLHASAGHGHEKAGVAVAQACAQRGATDVRVVDVLTVTPSFFGDGYKNFYIFLIKNCAWLWGFFYYLLDLPAVYALVRPLRRLVNSVVGQNLERLLADMRPDAVICTHFMSLEVVNHLKKKNGLDSFFIAVVTDFMPHMFWIERFVDVYAVAATETKHELERRGVPAEKIRITGIPVDKKFGQGYDRTVLLAEFGLRPDALTVLVTSGGAGIGPLYRIVEGLSKLTGQLQILVVCGTNKTLHARVSALASDRPFIKAFGFVDFMDKLMDVADVVIGKGGGLTVSESLCKGKPIVVFQPVPGQETRNAACVQKYGAGAIARSVDDVMKTVQRLQENLGYLNALKKAAAAMARPDAARQIAELAEHGSGQR